MKNEIFIYFFFLPDSEIPPQKLAALQKVLQSDFFNAVREVYEHVYETVDNNGSVELRASATAKVRFIFRMSYSNVCLMTHSGIILDPNYRKLLPISFGS